MNVKSYLLLSVLSAGMLTGCGGSEGDDSTASDASYNGSTEPATISEDNKSELSNSAIAISKSLVVNSDSANDVPTNSLGLNTPSSNLSFVELSSLITGPLSTLFSNLTLDDNGSFDTVNGCGGTLNFSGNEDVFTAIFNDYNDSSPCGEGSTNGSITFSGEEPNITLSYSNLTISDGTDTSTLDGTILMAETATTMLIEVDLDFTQNSENTSINLAMSCSDNNDTSTCVFSNFVDADNGITYRIDNSTITETTTDYWDLSGTFFDPENGFTTFDAANLILCTDNSGDFQSGSITLTDADLNVLQTTFNGCGAEATTTFTQADNTVS